MSTNTFRQFTMEGVNPSGGSGAQWLYVDGAFADVFCAYNNGRDGGDMQDEVDLEVTQVISEARWSQASLASTSARRATVACPLAR